MVGVLFLCFLLANFSVQKYTESVGSLILFVMRFEHEQNKFVVENSMTNQVPSEENGLGIM